MNPERFFESWRGLGALALFAYDFKKTGLCAGAAWTPAGLTAAVARPDLADYFLETITAAEVREGILVSYLFDSAATPGRLAFRVLVPHGGTLPSLASLHQGAEWHEREVADFFGLRFEGLPNEAPLLLPADFDGPPPLLKTPKEPAAALRDLKIFGQAEFLDPAWRAWAGPEGEAAA